DINIEKANQLIKKSKNHSNKEAAESANKEVVVVNEKNHKKPEVFQLKSNLEIVAWLYKE
ncbi:9210_t:CDS:2, partial [Rhizophagus irregularis]